MAGKTKSTAIKSGTTASRGRAKAAPKARPPAAATKQPAARAGHPTGPFTLAIDVGGTGLKASVLDVRGNMTTERVRIDTPQPCTPGLLVDGLAMLADQLRAQGQRWDRISVGFPGLVRHGLVITAPNLGNEAFAGFDLKAALEKRLEAPCRVVNDADMQGLAVVRGEGVEMVCTLGTGFGTALFMDGRLQVHLEIAHLPFRKGETYDQQLGDRAMKKIGKKKWLRRVVEALGHMRTLTNFDTLYVGGGNARHLDAAALPAKTVLVDNSAGILGGIRLWDDRQVDV
jgi:polyphosphate glucokinase